MGRGVYYSEFTSISQMKLPRSDLKFLKMSFKNARDAIERSKDRSKIVEVSNSRISFYITTKARLG